MIHNQFRFGYHPLKIKVTNVIINITKWLNNSFKQTVAGKTDTGNFILVMTFVFENTAEHPSTMHGRIYHHTLNATTSHGKYSTVMPLYVWAFLPQAIPNTSQYDGCLGTVLKSSKKYQILNLSYLTTIHILRYRKYDKHLKNSLL